MPKSPISKYPPEFEWMFEKPKEEKTLQRVGRKKFKSKEPSYWVFEELQEAYKANKMIGSGELRKFLGVSMASIRLFVKNQGLPAYRFGGSRGEYRFKPEEVNAWLLKKRV